MIVPDTRHLFLDTDALRRWDTGIIQQFPQPEKVFISGLEPGPAGSWDARCATIYGSVLKENGVFRMWYCAMPSVLSYKESADHLYVCYAESEDGIRWHKPDLRLVGQDRYPGNNLLPLPGCVMGVVPALSSTSARYLAVCIVPAGLNPEPDIWGKEFEFNGVGTYFFASDDGLRWRQLTRKPAVVGGDVACLIADPVSDRYLLYQKVLIMHGLETRRAFTLLQSRDGILWDGGGDDRPGSWSETFAADDYDDLQAAQAGYKVADHYCIAVHRIGGGLYVGVETIFQMGLPLRFKFSQNPYGRSIFRLAYSHDGRQWRHPKGRPVWMSPGETGERDAGFMVSANTFVEHEDHILMYYGGGIYSHGFFIEPDFTLRRDVPLSDLDNSCRIGMARIRRDRFAALAATYRGCFSLEAGCRQGNEILVNARCPKGSLRLQIANRWAKEALPGFSFEDCIPFTGDATRASIRFRNKTISDIPADTPLHLHFKICRGEVYGYEWKR